MLVTLAADCAGRGGKVGVFTPESKQLREPYAEVLSILSPVRRSANANVGEIRTTTGGVVDLWYTNDNVLAGRGREYDLVLGDEMAFTKNGQMLEVWDRSINPTMLTKPAARVWLFSTPNGVDFENFFWRACHPSPVTADGVRDTFDGFVEHYAPSTANPLVTADAMERERGRNHPLVFEQEFLAGFVDFRGVSFFGAELLLERDASSPDGWRGVPWPAKCDSVMAVVDSAVKSGLEHDGTAVSYYAYSAYGAVKLTVLDWDVVSVDGALLEAWMPQVFARLEELAVACRATYGSQGVFIEDAQSGSILLQQCANRGWPAAACPETVKAAGKDVRAMNAAGPVYRGEVRISAHAHDKVTTFHGVSRNHFESQVFGFRIGDKRAATRADDALDTFTYAVAINLGWDAGGVA